MDYDYHKYYSLVLPKSFYSRKGLSGLTNNGNTCYLNSIIQCLSVTHSLSDYLLSQEYKSDISGSKRTKKYWVACSYIHLLAKIWDSNDIYKPRSLKENMGQVSSRYHTVDQQDSHEFLLCLLQSLHEGLQYPVDINISGVSKNATDKLLLDSYKSLSKEYKNEYSKISEIFDGQFYTETKCNKCEYKNTTFDVFRTVSLDVNHDNLDENLSTLFNSSTLSDWKCQECNGSGKVKNRLWSCPNFVMIHFKRFDNENNKISKTITYPMELDLTKYISKEKKSMEKYIYTLYAVNCHSGSTPSSGHYFSLIKNESNWYMMNDCDVTKLGSSPSVRSDAYILFYYRKFIPKIQIV
jgi:ubiquitin C-terminal hydrolase